MTDHSNVKEVRQGALDRGVPTYQQGRPVEYHEIATQAGGGGGANYTYPAVAGDVGYYDLKGLDAQLSYHATVAGLVASATANIVITFYEMKIISGVNTYFLLETMAAINSPAVATGSVGKLTVSPTVKGATHFHIAGVVAVAVNSTVYFGYDLFEPTTIPIDGRAIPVSTIASNLTVVKNTVVWYPGAVVAAAPAACWDTSRMNANGKKAKSISFTGKIVATTGEGYFKVYATDDPNTTVASKRWVQIGLDNITSTVRSFDPDVTCPINTTISFVVNLNDFMPRYLVISFSETANSANLTGVYLDATFDY